jgi:hypothetical protein
VPFGEKSGPLIVIAVAVEVGLVGLLKKGAVTYGRMSIARKARVGKPYSIAENVVR